MKKVFMFLVAAMMLGMAMPTMAQQKKAPVKKTTTTTKKSTTTQKQVAKKKTPAKPAAVSVPFEGPGIVDGHLAFMGIPLNESPANMKSKLMAKGLQSKRNDSGNGSLEVKGLVDGVQTIVEIAVSYKKDIWAIHMRDASTVRLPKAKARFETLLAKVESIYGKGECVDNYDDHKHYLLKSDKGSISVELFNEDEMDGASDFYVISVSFSEHD